MRNLASIQKIISLEPIEGKDRIELATILGWHVIVEKGQYKVGDLVIYCEVDSILPEHPHFEFLRARCSSKKYRGFRIKTLKFGQTISQGICFPISPLLDSPIKRKIEEGVDVTDYLKVTKYDPEAWEMEKESHKRGPIMRWFMKWRWFRWIWRKLTGNDKPKKAAWPEFISKTDETRIQAVPSVVEEYKDVVVYASEKMDGCLDESSLILTESGIIPISKLVADFSGVRVLTYNETSDTLEYKQVLGSSVTEKDNKQWYEIVLADGNTLKVTGNHRIYLPFLKCWRKVEDLVVGDDLLLN